MSSSMPSVKTFMSKLIHRVSLHLSLLSYKTSVVKVYIKGGKLLLHECQVQKSAKMKGHMIAHLLNFIIIK